MTCDAPSHDFGQVARRAAAALQHQFALTNTSNRPVQIVKHSASCNCTVPTVPKGPIAPGETVTIPVKVDFSDRAGRHSTSIAVVTDSPTTPPIILKVSASVKIPAVLSRDVIDFGPLRMGDRRTRIVTLGQGTDDLPFRVVN